MNEINDIATYSRAKKEGKEIKKEDITDKSVDAHIKVVKKEDSE